MKSGLYFAKPGVLFNPNANYVNPEGQKITEKGVRYFESIELSESIRKKIAEIPFIKELSEKYETFVSVIQAKTNSGEPIGKIEIQYANYKKKKVKRYEIYGIITNRFKRFLASYSSTSGKEFPKNLKDPIDIAIAKIQNGIFD